MFDRGDSGRRTVPRTSTPLCQRPRRTLRSVADCRTRERRRTWLRPDRRSFTRAKVKQRQSVIRNQTSTKRARRHERNPPAVAKADGESDPVGGRGHDKPTTAGFCFSIRTGSGERTEGAGGSARATPSRPTLGHAHAPVPVGERDGHGAGRPRKRESPAASMLAITLTSMPVVTAIPITWNLRPFRAMRRPTRTPSRVAKLRSTTTPPGRTQLPAVTSG